MCIRDSPINDDKNNKTDKSFASLIGKKSGAQGNCQISACEHSDTGEQNGDDGERNTCLLYTS